jgi:TonB family protein
MTRHFGLESVIASYSLRISLVLAFAIFVPSCATAQEPQINELAARFARELNKKYEKTVVVFDFVGPNTRLNALGEKMAADFREALSKSPASFVVTNRTQITQALSANDLSPQILHDPDMQRWLARKLGPGIMISGELETKPDGLDVSVHTHRVVDGKAINGFKITLALTAEMKSLLDMPPAEGQEKFSNIPEMQPRGYSSPKCGYCPAAVYTDQAAKKHIQGTVILRAVVGTDGKAHDINVMRPLPNGLTENAIDAVRSWTFKPATDTNGVPVALGTVFEVAFHLY